MKSTFLVHILGCSELKKHYYVVPANSACYTYGFLMNYYIEYRIRQTNAEKEMLFVRLQEN